MQPSSGSPRKLISFDEVLLPFLFKVGQFHHVAQVWLELMAVYRLSVVERKRRAVVLPSLGED
jgi:hypothetical protein